MFYFHPYLGKIPILTHIFQMGWKHQLVVVSKIFGIFTPTTSGNDPIFEMGWNHQLAFFTLPNGFNDFLEKNIEFFFTKS